MDRTEKFLKVAMVTSWSIFFAGAMTLAGLTIYQVCKPKQKEEEKVSERQEEFIQKNCVEVSRTYGEYKFEIELDRAL